MAFECLDKLLSNMLENPQARLCVCRYPARPILSFSLPLANLVKTVERYFELRQPQALFSSLSFSFYLPPHLSFNSLHNYSKWGPLMNIQFCLRFKNNVDSCLLLLPPTLCQEYFFFFYGLKAKRLEAQETAAMCRCVPANVGWPLWLIRLS